MLYAAVGAELTQYDVDVDTATLVKRGSITLPASVQEAVTHPSRQYLYIAWSNGGPSNIPQGSVAPKGSQHGLSAFRIEPASGALIPHGAPATCPRGRFTSPPISPARMCSWLTTIRAE